MFWIFLVAIALHQLGMTSYYSFFTLYLKDELGMQQAAWVWSIGAVAEIPMVLFAGRIIRRFGLAILLMVSMAAVSLRVGLLSLVPPLGVICLTQLLHAMTFGLLHVAAIEDRWLLSRLATSTSTRWWVECTRRS